MINPANNNFLYVGTEVGIFASEDAGATWQLPQGGPALVSVDELFLYQGDLLAATHGRGIYTTRAPVLDLPVCGGGGGSGGCPPGFCGQAPSACCRLGDWECSCTWNNGQVPTQNDDVAVYCPITVNGGGATARNLRVDGRLSFNAGGVSVVGDVANFGLIESVGSFSSSLSANNVLNVRPDNAVTLRGIISLNQPLTARGNIANFGIITGSGIELNGPAGATQNLSGTGSWGNAYLRIHRTARLTSDVTLDTGFTEVRPFARLQLNDRTLNVNSSTLSNLGTIDLGAGTLNFSGTEFNAAVPSFGDPDSSVQGSGTVILK
ncbi:MAG: hypothetical protein ACRERS_11620, partial [Methylococcales bacterium]